MRRFLDAEFRDSNLPDELADDPPPGICLERGFLPPGVMAESLVYRPVADVTPGGQLVPPPDGAVDEIGRIQLPVDIVVIDLREPDLAYKKIGSFVAQDDELVFVSRPPSVP